uniref:Uncharacterized protein n=1 Tax=Candidatus Kentrum sp. TC TaxID=2126339 RepID=A0A450ZP33_9GAMM|nr:MAG: hypothetical protein BECKTC1821F_GA0114240_10072 [Candidatus Kentron sp. TC]
MDVASAGSADIFSAMKLGFGSAKELWIRVAFRMALPSEDAYRLSGRTTEVAHVVKRLFGGQVRMGGEKRKPGENLTMIYDE